VIGMSDPDGWCCNLETTSAEFCCFVLGTVSSNILQSGDCTARESCRRYAVWLNVSWTGASDIMI